MIQMNHLTVWKMLCLASLERASGSLTSSYFASPWKCRASSPAQAADTPGWQSNQSPVGCTLSTLYSTWFISSYIAAYIQVLYRIDRVHPTGLTVNQGCRQLSTVGTRKGCRWQLYRRIHFLCSVYNNLATGTGGLHDGLHIANICYPILSVSVQYRIIPVSVWTSISVWLIRYINLADIRWIQNPIFRIVDRYCTIPARRAFWNLAINVCGRLCG